MLRRETTRQQGPAYWVKTACVLVLIFSTAAVMGARTSDSLRGTDFPDFYCAARMLLDGHGHQLYDVNLQHQYQAAYAGRVGTLYIHPPFESVLYLVVAWLPLRRAYLLWTLLSLALLAAGSWRLAKDALRPWDWRTLLASSLTFVPLLLCLLQGQDSLLLLLLLVLTFTDLRRGRAFAAGCWLGLGLFKFQLVLPLTLVLVLTQSRGRRIALARGFGLLALALAGLSAAISGWSVFSVYPSFLLHLQSQTFAGIGPQAMANFRGLAYMFFHHDQSPWAVAFLSVLSAAALGKTLMEWKHVEFVSDSGPATETQDKFDLALANTVLFALLVSFHLNPHDLSLLLLPISVLLHSGFVRKAPLTRSAKWTILGLIAILFLPPLHLWGVRAAVYAFVAIPILLLFLLSGSLLRQSKAPHITLHIHKDQGEN